MLSTTYSGEPKNQQGCAQQAGKKTVFHDDSPVCNLFHGHTASFSACESRTRTPERTRTAAPPILLLSATVASISHVVFQVDAADMDVGSARLLGVASPATVARIHTGSAMATA